MNFDRRLDKVKSDKIRTMRAVDPLAGGASPGSPAARLEDLERKVEMLQWCTFGLAGIVAMGAATAALRRRKLATFTSISASRIMLVQPSGSLRTPDRLMADLSVKSGGRTELRMHGGSLHLTNPDRTEAVQLSAQFSPPPAQAPSSSEGEGIPTPLGSGQAWAMDRHGLESQLRPLRSRPALMLYGPDARPLGAVSAAEDASSGGWVTFGPTEPAVTDPGAGTRAHREPERRISPRAVENDADSLGVPSSGTEQEQFETPFVRPRIIKTERQPSGIIRPPRAFDFTDSTASKRQAGQDGSKLDVDEPPVLHPSSVGLKRQ